MNTINFSLAKICLNFTTALKDTFYSAQNKGKGRFLKTVISIYTDKTVMCILTLEVC